MIGGALYSNNNMVPGGTFYIDPFLQMRTTSGNTTEQGYNTSGAYQFNEQRGDTSDLKLGAVPLTTIGGIEYREFLLAINEGGGDPQISLDQLKIFLSPTASRGLQLNDGYSLALACPPFMTWTPETRTIT